jgi:hypothetical protein
LVYDHILIRSVVTRVEASSISCDLSPKEEEELTALHEGERAFNANDAIGTILGFHCSAGHNVCI